MALRWTAFPLHPDTPEEGRSLEDLFAGRPVNIPEMLAHLKKTADQLDLPFGVRRMTFNSRRAQELGKWAEKSGIGKAFHKAVFEAYFADGRNIALLPVLLGIVADIGGDPEEARRALEEGRFKTAVDQDWQRSRSMGITAVPTFVNNGRHLVGAQHYQDLARFISQGNGL
jgi:predicted DsbA family dithiol-disulfide isomerase